MTFLAPNPRVYTADLQQTALQRRKKEPLWRIYLEILSSKEKLPLPRHKAAGRGGPHSPPHSPISPIYWHCSENNPKGLAGLGFCSLWIFSIWGSIQQLKHRKDFYKLHPSINYILLWHILVFTRFTWEMKQKLITSTDTSRKWMDLISPPDGLPLPGSTHSTSYSREAEGVRKAHLSHQTDTSLLQRIYFLSRALTEVS